MSTPENAPLLRSTGRSRDSSSGVSESSGGGSTTRASGRAAASAPRNIKQDGRKIWSCGLLSAWNELPFTMRMSVFSSITLLWVLLFYILPMVNEYNFMDESQNHDASVVGNIELLSELTANYIREKRAAVSYLAGQFTSAKYSNMTAAMDATDANVYMLIQSSLRSFLAEDGYEEGGGDQISVSEATGMNLIRDVRSSLSTKAASSTASDPRLGPAFGYTQASFTLPSVQRVRETYNLALDKATSLLASQSVYYCRNQKIGSHFQAVGLAMSAQNLIVAAITGQHALNHGGQASAQFLRSWLSSTLGVDTFFSPFQYPKDNGALLKIRAAHSQGALAKVQDALSSNIEAMAVNLTNLGPDVVAPMQAFVSTLEKDDGPEASYFNKDVVVGTIILATLVYTLATWTHFEWFLSGRARRLMFTSNIMHDVHVRVNEFVHAFSTFSLELPPPPVSMQGTPVGVVELRLQQCLASLKALAPTLPPLMFTEQAHAIAKQLSAVRDPASLSSQRRTRDSLKDIAVELLPLDSTIENNRFINEMSRLTVCGSSVVHVVCLTVDITCFSELGRTGSTGDDGIQAMSKSLQQLQPTTAQVEDSYVKVVSCVEATVCQFGGIMHFVGLGMCMGVWCVPEEDGPADCNQVVTCGALLGRRLHALRRGNSQLMNTFRPYIGVTAGKAVRSIFGTAQTMKCLQLFGAPLIFGHTVATVNHHHQTMLACDQTVCDGLRGSRPCKPIEIIKEGLLVTGGGADAGAGLGSGGGNGHLAFRADMVTKRPKHHTSYGRVYEVLVGSGGDGGGLPPDIEARLTMYCKGFELYERGFYREASRAFRAYTKLYGYDSSVERIQSAISII